MADKRDYYDVLGIKKGASDDDIKKAFRQKAKQYHPDLNPDDETSEKNFKEVNEAYEILSNPQKKGSYDSFGHAGVDPSYGGGAGGGGGASYYGGGGIDFSDLFSDIFGGGFGGFGGTQRGATRRDPNAPLRGEDIEKNISISFKESIKGAKKRMTFSKLDGCKTCSGKGAVNASDITTCSTCNGTGSVTVVQQSILGNVQTRTTCSTCRGTGQEIKNPCPTCHGEKRVKINDSIEFSIPEGIDDGQTISISQKGNAGANSGPAGDLYVNITVRPDEFFERRRNDIYCEIPITFAQAALGAKIEVPTVDGPIERNISPGTQPDTVLRIRDKGVKSIGTRIRGDQFTTLKVEVPTKLNSQQKKSITEMDELLGDVNSSNYEKRKGFFDKLKDWVNE